MITLRASAAHSWMKCSMSHHVTAHPSALPDVEIDAAREGTCAAWVAETIINGDATCVEDMVGKVHPNGWEVDEDMARHLNGYVEMLQSRRSPQAEVYREASGTNVTLAGTLDAESFDGDVLCIDDLKFGYDIVEAPENPQLLSYLTLRYCVLDAASIPDRIRLGIYQPRAIHPDGIYRQWEITKDEALHWIAVINNRAVEIASTHPLGSPGMHCNHCQGAAICDALTRSVYTMWAPIESRAYVTPSNQQLADELEMLDRFDKMLKARRAAVEAETEIRLDRNEFIPGWAKMPKKGNRIFTIPPEMIKGLTGIDPYDQKTVTPAELERRGANPKIVEKITKHPLVGYKLTRVTDKAIAALFK